MKPVAKFAISIGILVGVGTLAYAGYTFFKTEMKKLMNWCYKIKSYKINAFDLQHIDMTLQLLFRNNSDFDLTIYGYNLNVYLNDTLITKLSNTISQTINNNSVTLLTLPVNVVLSGLMDFGKIADLVTKYLTDTSKIIIKVEGTISAGVSGLQVKDLPFSMSMSLKEIMTDDPNAEKCTVY